MSVTNAVGGPSMGVQAGVASKSPSLVAYLTIALQFGLFLVLVHQYDLISRAFLNLGILSLAGWTAHYFLPQKYRLGLFVLLSLLGIELVFGFQAEQWSADGLIQGAWIIVLGLGLIALANLPVPIVARLAVIGAVGLILGLARAGFIPVPWSAAIWPIFGSMFMFRMIVYLYQRHHDAKKKPATLMETLAYFFMLPNVVFPLFPVVDFRTFRRTYYNHPDRHRIYQSGIQWMFRGAFHLLLYRLLNQVFVIDPADVANRGDLVQFLLWPFLLYLRVSGTFHIVTGMLHLFGFNLPETHKLFFLSSSFTDFWRRINIYWKDFIMQVFYYPLYFKLRRYGDTTALIVATFLAFIATWILHGYQWFWLRGSWLLSWNDGLFWAILALLVVGNALYEVKHGRKRRLKGDALSWTDTLATAMRTLGVFATISILWSFWTAGSIGEWLIAWGGMTAPSMSGEANLLLVAVIVAVGIPAAVQARGLQDAPFNFKRSAGLVIVSAALAVIIAQPNIHRPFGRVVRDSIASMKSTELNRRDFARLERGYYEKLMDVGGFNPELWEVYRSKPADWVPLEESDVVVHRAGQLPFYELRPSVEIRHNGALVRTNRWGMRDRDYAKTPPPGTLRIALMGASFVFGNGIENDDGFGTLLEQRLNREAAGGSYDRYEVLNFGVGGYSPLERLAQLESEVLGFAPDYIFYVEHSGASAAGKLIRALRNQVDHPYDFLREIVSKAGVDLATLDDTVDGFALAQQLRPYDDEILAAIYRRTVEVSRARNIPAVWIFLPRPEDSDQAPPERELRLAREAGFHIIDLSGLYGDHDLSSLWVARWDHHTNALGNQLIEARLYELLRQASDTIPLGLDRPAGTGPAGTGPAGSGPVGNR